MRPHEAAMNPTMRIVFHCSRFKYIYIYIMKHCGSLSPWYDNLELFPQFATCQDELLQRLPTASLCSGSRLIAAFCSLVYMMEPNLKEELRKASMTRLLQLIIHICGMLLHRLGGTSEQPIPSAYDPGQAESDSTGSGIPTAAAAERAQPPVHHQPQQPVQRQYPCEHHCMHCTEACIRARHGHKHHKCRLHLHWR